MAKWMWYNAPSKVIGVRGQLVHRLIDSQLRLESSCDSSSEPFALSIMHTRFARFIIDDEPSSVLNLSVSPGMLSRARNFSSLAPIPSSLDTM